MLFFIRPCRSQTLINLRGYHWTIDSALTQISSRTGHTFLYRSDLFAKVPPIDLQLVNVGWEEALHLCVAGLDLGLVPHGDSTTLIVVPGDGSLHYTPLKGRVRGEDGQPLAGATIFLEGARTGVLADGQGDFSLPVTSFYSRVTISYAGYVSRTGNFSNRNEVDIVLRLPGPLDAAVVLPYGQTTRGQSTANSFEVRDTSLQDGAANNLLEALQGWSPGVSIRRYNGVPGSGFEVLLGGRHSIQQGNDPLYVVDGVPWATNGFLSTVGSGSAQGPNGASALNGIPIAFVGSISVMTDAAATAIYGSRASNGVVLVTLKEGRPDRPLLTADVNAGVSRTGPTSRLLNTQQFLQMRQEAIQNDGRPVNDSSLPERFKWDPSRYTDFKKTTMGGTGFVQNARVDWNGGGTRDRFLVSGRWHKETTVFPGSFYDQDVSLYGNYRHTSGNRKLKVAVSGVMNQETVFLPQQDLSQFQYLAPNTPGFANSQWGTPSLPYVNILALTHNNYHGDLSTVLAHGELSYAFASRFTAEARVGYNGLFTREHSYLRVAGQAPYLSPPPRNDTTVAENDYNSEIAEGLMRYHGPVSREDGQMDALVGMTYQEQRTSYCSQRAILTANGTVTPGLTTASVNNRYKALFARATYVFHNKYILSASLRRDGSTKFGDGFVFGNFWSVGGAWIFRQGREGFSFGKFKASYGTTGNEQIGARLYDTSTVKMVDKDLRWEVNHRAEAGLDLGFFRDRLLFTAIAYRSWTDEQLIYYLGNPFRGTVSHFALVPANVVNTGLEFQVSAQAFTVGSVKWGTQLSLTIPSNRLKSFPGLDSSSLAGTLTVGRSLTAAKGYQLKGVNTQTGVYMFQPAAVGSGLALVPSASLDPRWYAGWSNTLQTGNWEFRFFFEWREQNGANPLTALSKRIVNGPGSEQGTQQSNGPVEWLDHWREPGDRSSQQRLTTGANAQAKSALQAYVKSGAAVTGASYWRLKTAAIYYRWREAQLRKMPGVQGIAVYLRGQDLWRISRFPVTDPETQDPTVLPPARIVEAGFSVQFGKRTGSRVVASRPVP